MDSGLALGRALDLGCGIGINALWLAKRGWEVTGVDWAGSAIEKARATAAKKGLDVTFEVGDVTTWEPSHQYDLVVSTFALPSAGEPRKRAVTTAAASLAPGGTLLLVEWDRSSPGQQDWDPEDLVTVDELVGYLGKFTIEKATTVSVDIEAHARRDGHEHAEVNDHSEHDRGDGGS